jgi:hypothetical protein
MAGDLTAALLSGNAGVAADPMLAQIAPRMQLAQALSQQGMSGAPTTGWGLGGRLASALAGAAIQGDASSELTHLYEGGIDAASKALPSDHPLQPYLQSKNPLARMLGYKALDKALIQLSEPKGAKPGETFGYAVPGQQPTIANTGAAAAAAEAAKNPSLIARAAGTAAAEAPYKPGGDVTVQTPNGPQTIPATAATRAAIQPASAGISGKPEGQDKLYGAASEALGKVIGEHIEAGGKSARDKLNALDTMESALATGGKGIITGPNAEFALKAKQALNGMGISADWIDKGLPESELITKMNAQLASASAKAMTGRPTQNEFNIWMRNNPGLLTSKEGTKALIGVLRQQTENDIALGRLAQKRGNWENWGETVDKFYEGHGLKDPLTGKPMKDEIAAAHAGAPAGGNPNEPTGVTRQHIRVSSPEEARKLPKGTPILLPDGRSGVVP